MPGATVDKDPKKATPGSGTPAGPSPISAKMRSPGLMPAKPAPAKRSAPRPINMPLSPAVPRPQTPNVPTGVHPTTGTQVIRPARRTSASHVLCSRCSMPMSADAVQKGEAELISGVAVCKPCVRKAAERQRAARSLQLLLVSFVVVSVALAIFFPSQMLFAGVIVSALVALSGVIGFTLSGQARAALIVGGLVFAAAGTLVIRSMSKSTQNDTVAHELAQDAQEVKQLIQEDRAADAEQRLNALAARATDDKGRYVSAQAERSVADAREALDAHFRNKHGSLDARERDVLKFLQSAFQDKSGT
ncbi:MAG TPA: hypothetical protein VEJ63_04940, partial [Planctomycetota bacterium]|nr:hypothetical protein [Planctomycetota bacterium]